MKLVGDIGGTRSRLALADEKCQLHSATVFANEEYPDFAALLDGYLGTLPAPPQGGCLAVAGPVSDDGRSAQLTNRPWLIDLDALEPVFGLAGMKLVNDFAAAAMGVTTPTPAMPLLLQEGVPLAGGLRVVLGAGTGLGVASLICCNGRWKVLPGEGGHIGFAPQDERQDELCRWLRKRHGRLIIEHVVSGSGLSAIHEFLHGEAADPAKIAHLANQSDAQALESFDLFASIYGAVAGDYALACMARGGVFLAGGISAANLLLMQRGPFVKAFNSKGVHTPLAGLMPVCIVTEPLLGLYGAAALAD